MNFIQVVRDIAPYDVELTDDECQELFRAVRASLGKPPPAPHIFDTEARQLYAEEYIRPLIEGVSRAKLARKLTVAQEGLERQKVIAQGG